MKYRATININKDIWDKFRAKCEAAGSTATAELTAFMELINDDREYDYQRLQNDWESLPETVKTITDFMYGKLDITMEYTVSHRMKKIHQELEQKFEELEQKFLSATDRMVTDEVTDEVTNNGTDEVTDDDALTDSERSNMLAHDPAEQLLAAAITTKSDDESENYPLLYIGDKEISEVRRIKNILQFDRAIEGKALSDTELADLTKIPRSTINQMRTGRLKPKEKIIAKYALNPSGTGWIEK